MQVLIVGAGIAGFSAAIACRRAGHEVHIYEKSSMNQELGAAIHLPPNASRGLLAWGFDTVKARAVICKKSYRAHASSLVRFYETDEANVTPTFGAPWFLVHRVDLHEGLKRLATQEEGEGKPAIVHLKSEIVEYDPEAGLVTLWNGEKHFGDLVIAADGVHTKAVEAVLGHQNPALPTQECNFAYRFLIPSKDIAEDPETARFLEDDDGRIKFLVMEGKRLVWYPCRNNEVHNFVALFHNDDVVGKEDWTLSVDKSVLLERFKDFHPSAIAVLKKAKEIRQWPLLFRAPIPSWHKGKLLLIGDAAHPMLPHQGQGGAQAIEDSVALGILLTDVNSGTLEKRLQQFEKIRRNRASVMQIFSNAAADEPEKIRQEAAKFIPADSVPTSPQEYSQYNFGYDVVRDAKQTMEAANPGWKLPTTFFEKEPGPGVYPPIITQNLRVQVDQVSISHLPVETQA